MATACGHVKNENTKGSGRDRVDFSLGRKDRKIEKHQGFRAHQSSLIGVSLWCMGGRTRDRHREDRDQPEPSAQSGSTHGSSLRTCLVIMMLPWFGECGHRRDQAGSRSCTKAAAWAAGLGFSKSKPRPKPCSGRDLGLGWARPIWARLGPARGFKLGLAHHYFHIPFHSHGATAPNLGIKWTERQILRIGIMLDCLSPSQNFWFVQGDCLKCMSGYSGTLKSKFIFSMSTPTEKAAAMRAAKLKRRVEATTTPESAPSRHSTEKSRHKSGPHRASSMAEPDHAKQAQTLDKKKPDPANRQKSSVTRPVAQLFESDSDDFKVDGSDGAVSDFGAESDNKLEESDDDSILGLIGDKLKATLDYERPQFTPRNDPVRKRLTKDAKYPEGRIGTIRGNVRKAAQAHVASHYGPMKGADERVADLLKNKAYIYPVNAKGDPIRTKPFQAPAILDTIKDAFFSDELTVGVKWHDHLTSTIDDHPDEVELPVAMVALASAAYSSEKFDRDFNSDMYGGIYRTLVGMLNGIFEASKRKFHVLVHSLYKSVYGSKRKTEKPNTADSLMFLDIEGMAEE
ncbi:uncharacterized protein EDB91DRAFT_1085767 [Suillus paluster]|uniref:uncharacterized protein n=1 Tax=Suillus paluster TaxID=48578 RepID=UPI001B86B7D9|nr:uncharacterized protein EDB91DRAFT_1085767 [Suillus paluster]KAG1729322.1 hypothetical protein EDB91DRAFT_1085767 [Suillus paluster]